jgi:hypothetical protein
MKWTDYVLVVVLSVVFVMACFALPLNSIMGWKENDCRKIRTFSGVHTLVWKDTLWRLEPVELDKAGVRDVRLSSDSTKYKR